MTESTLSSTSPSLEPISPNATRRADWVGAEGRPWPLGATWTEDGKAINFALYSEFATGATLRLYAPNDQVNPVYQLSLDHLFHKTGRIWHCRVPAETSGRAAYFAWRVDGPWDPGSGQRFDPTKDLVDPYAHVIYFPPTFDRDACRQKGDNAGRAPLGVLPKPMPPFDWSGDCKPRHTSDTVIYEVHVGGFTRHGSSGIAPARHGTYAGLIDKIPYLQELGITAIELMPVFQFDPAENNYWGYMPFSFFAPHDAYSSDRSLGGQLDEFRAMVKALHQAGIEVILDVVYNHTAELDERGPTYSYRGIDNRSYYLLAQDMTHYRDDTGAGNVLHCANRLVRRMILDSLRYWVTEMHVDGFRFDLASIFTRSDDGSLDLEHPAIIAEISADPAFADIRLIAEAWDPASYQLGHGFPGVTWLQWNGKFRDDIRAFVRGDSGKVPDLMTRLYGSSDLFPDSIDSAYHSYQSVNYISSHDGFCLYDLVAYNGKHNQANGENNQDGTDANFSWNCGVEGDDGAPPEVIELRNRQIKNFCCLLFLANGTPMFGAGDEFLRTRKGNNNPYNQDNDTTWLHWDLLEKHRDLFRFFQRMIAFRKSHPGIGRSRYWREDVRWFGVAGQPDLSWDSHSLAFHLRGTAEADDELYIMINAWWQPLTFQIQVDGSWCRVVDTALPSPQDFRDPGAEPGAPLNTYLVQPRSVVILLQERGGIVGGDGR